MAHYFEEIDGKLHRIDDWAVILGLAVDVERKNGMRTLTVLVIGTGRPHVQRDPRGIDALVEKARTNAFTADDLGGEHQPDQLGWDWVGAQRSLVEAARDDRRHRLHRLSGGFERIGCRSAPRR